MAQDRLSERVSLSAVGTTGTSAALNGDIIDFASNGGWESALGIGHQSASLANGTATAGPLLKFQMGTASDSLSDATGEVMGTKTNLYLDVYRPIKRFGRFVFQAGTATCAFRSLQTVVYGPRKAPTTHPASSTGARLSSPGSGTATG